jgi:hypothetical protein
MLGLISARTNKSATCQEVYIDREAALDRIIQVNFSLPYKLDRVIAEGKPE